MMDELKLLLKSQGLLLNLMEVGCGSPISEAFMSEDGASDYIYGSQSPYHKTAQHSVLDNKFKYRSVSGQFVKDACAKMGGDRYLKGPKCIDIAISMQVGYNKDNHGWICISDKIIYHFTFGYSTGREFARSCIVNLVEDLLLVHYGNKLDLSQCNAKYIDGCFGHSDSEEFLLKHFIVNGMPEHHAPFMIVDGQWERATVGLRFYKNLNIVKGSFNPYHEGHKELMELFPGQSILSITTAKTVGGKDRITTEIAIERALASKENTLIDSAWPYYQDLINGLFDYINLEDGTALHFSMGVDTFAKFTPINGISTHVFSRNIESKDISFYTSKYPNISSTKIRKQNEINK